jgi:transglutaminase-like putative cysteine protease
MILRLLRKILTVNAVGLLLVILALQILTYGVSSSLRDTDTKFLFPICLTAALVGLGLSKSKLNGILASVVIAALGLISIWVMGAGLVAPLIGLLQSASSVIPQLNPALRTPVVVDKVAILVAWDIIVQASLALTTRLQTWMIALSQNVTVNDPLVRNMLWTLALWFISAWVGWFTGRRNAIAALLPSIALLAAVTSYSEYKTVTIWLMVSVLLLLMGVWNYKNHTQQWETRKVDYSESILYDSGQAVFFLTMVIGVFAFITPSISWRDIRDYFRERDRPSKNETASILGIQEQRTASQSYAAKKPELPREHLLAGGFALSEKIVMTIRTGELHPLAESSLLMSVPRYYWRSVTYDEYVGTGWLTSSAPPQTYQANTPLIAGFLDGYRLVHLDVNMEEPEGKLFWSGILFSADVPFTANWRLRPQTGLFADQSALLQADMFAAISSAVTYKAESYVPVISIKQLRSASTEYPGQIREQYLALPQSVPERVHELAREIVAAKPNPYDKAKAIENYLRTYPYDLEVSAPPEDQDVADYFLFDLKRGYCDYYATAMVVLARSSGIPARFVSGYSPGSYDAPNARYIVRELNAHSWAEIYFPEIGWVEFEPTASEPEIERQADELPASLSPDEDSTVSTLLNQYRFKMTLLWASPFLVLLFLSFGYFIFIERWLYMRLAPAAAIERIYQKLYELGRPLAGKYTQAETAYEFTERLIHRIEETKKRTRFAKFFANTQSDIERLTNIYYASLFSQYQSKKNDALTAFNTWKHLRPRLMIARLKIFLTRIVLSVTKNLRRNKRDSAVVTSIPSDITN